jgi:septal ring factor EnvC (AmiA/AmiB activator)
MTKSTRILAIIGLAAIVSACDEGLLKEKAELETQLAQCEDVKQRAIAANKEFAEREEIRARMDDEKVAKGRAEFEHWQREAQIALACDAIIPTCPAAMTDPGRKALETGFYGGGGGLYAAIVALKILALALLAGLSVGLFFLARYLVERPSADALIEAREAIERAQTAEDDARQQVAEQERALERVRHELKARRADVASEEQRLADARHETANEASALATIREQIAQAQVELAALKSAKEAFSGL